MSLSMFDPFSHDRMVVSFDGTQAGAEPLTWGQKAILRDMRDSGNQFTMGGRLDLPEGSTIEDATARLSGLMSRHAALRMRLAAGDAGALCQEVAASGQMDLDIVTIPDDVDPAHVAPYAAELMDKWSLERFDFHTDWPLRMALVRHGGACRSLVWSLSHLVADGGAHLLLLDDLLADGKDSRADRPQILDVARSEQDPQVRQVSSRAMRHWEAQLENIPAQTFGEPAGSAREAGSRYWQARFTSPATHLATLAIARRTGTDLSRVTLAVIATAIARVTGVNPLTIKAMVNNRFRQGMADVIAPLAQNSVMTIDMSDVSVDDVVRRARGAALTAGMRAYYDPDDLSEVMTRLDIIRGYPAKVTLRINDQRAMVMRADDQLSVDEITPRHIDQRLEETSLTWLGPRENMHEQANILVENRSDVVSLHMMWDLWSLSNNRVEAILRAVEEVALEAAFDPAAPTKVS